MTEYVVPQLNDLQPDIAFHHDGAPLHWGLEVWSYLDEHFPQRWIGRDCPIPCPSRSSDVTPIDFFLVGYVEDNVYKFKLNNIND